MPREHGFMLRLTAGQHERLRQECFARRVTMAGFMRGLLDAEVGKWDVRDRQAAIEARQKGLEDSRYAVGMVIDGQLPDGTACRYMRYDGRWLLLLVHETAERALLRMKRSSWVGQFYTIEGM